MATITPAERANAERVAAEVTWLMGFNTMTYRDVLRATGYSSTDSLERILYRGGQQEVAQKWRAFTDRRRRPS